MTNQKTAQKIAQRLSEVHESATLRLNALVQEMKGRGEEVINLTAGEPDFWVPDEVKDAMIEAIRSNKSRYTPVPGIPELRTAIAERTNRQQPELSRKWKATEVVVANGAKQSLFNSVLALANPGDEVVFQAPHWLSYPEMARIADAKPVVIETSMRDGFKLRPEALKKALTAKSRILILNSPSNPTGATYTRAEFEALGKVIRDFENLIVISDEIYDRMTYRSEGFTSFLSAVPDLQDRTITVNGLSKTYAMTGWRVGWSVASSWISQTLSTLQGQSTSGINAPAQYAALKALELPDGQFLPKLESFKKRRQRVLDILAPSGKIEVFPPEGAFYAWVGVKGVLQTGEDATGFAERLLKEARVAVVPGGPFGAPTFVRMSFATDDRTLEEGCRRIAQFTS